MKVKSVHHCVNGDFAGGLRRGAWCRRRWLLPESATGEHGCSSAVRPYIQIRFIRSCSRMLIDNFYRKDSEISPVPPPPINCDPVHQFFRLESLAAALLQSIDRPATFALARGISSVPAPVQRGVRWDYAPKSPRRAVSSGGATRQPILSGLNPPWRISACRCALAMRSAAWDATPWKTR